MSDKIIENMAKVLHDTHHNNNSNWNWEVENKTSVYDYWLKLATAAYKASRHEELVSALKELMYLDGGAPAFKVAKELLKSMEK